MTKATAIKIWFQERFPAMHFISGFFLFLLPLSLSNSILSWPQIICGSLIPAFHLLLLRVFDEHKDYENDLINNPQRPLQRGLLKLSDVRNIGVIAFLLQALCVLSFKPSLTTLAMYLLLCVWTLLMAKEFLIGSWLKKHFLLYAISHLFITPFILMFCGHLVNLSEYFFPEIFALGFLSGFIYEVARKTKSPSEETGDTSYSKLWGIKISVIVVLSLGILMSLSGVSLFTKLNILNFVTMMLVFVVLVLHCLVGLQHIRLQTPQTRKKLEGTSSLIGTVIFIAPVVWYFMIKGT